LSVLLEALKKAAEDKKKALENSEQPNKVEVSPVQEVQAEKNTSREPSLESESLERPAEIKLSLNESVASAPSEKIKKPDVPPLSPEVALKLDLSLGSPQKTEKTPNSLSNSDEGETKAKAQASLKLVIEEPSEQNESLLDKSLSEEAVTLAAEQEITKSASSSDGSTRLKMDLSDEPLVEKPRASLKEGSSIAQSDSSEKTGKMDFQLAKEELDCATVMPALTNHAENPLESVPLDESRYSSENKQVFVSNEAPLDTVLEKKAERESIASERKQPLEHIPEHHSKRSNIHTDKKRLKEDEDSYKWSLDALPGYLGLGKKKKIKKTSSEGDNPILVSGALSEDPNRPLKKTSIKLILILLVLLLFIGILFYGALYYQEQHDALEQRMKKYNLVKTHIAVENEPEVINKSLENKTEKPEGTSTEEGLSQMPLNEVVRETTLIEGTQKSSMGGGSQASAIRQPQSDVEASATDDLTRQKREEVETTSERKVSNQVVNVPNVPTQTLDKTRMKTENSMSPKAVIEVHSEENVLSEAYLSYEQGDFFHAQQAFEEVLTINPQNEFALIGLGNILASKQQYIAAMGYYQKALIAQPSSLNAFEAIANISGHIELGSDWKNSLKEMVQDHSESATLQYALGNLYAEESDWLAAQSAYFQAVALEPDNSDYLVNLAVSLDQLGKYHLAARYYTEALAFVDVESVNFNETQVKDRLISIRKFMAEKER